MAKAPANIDPEKFIFGGGHYNNLRTAMPYFADGVFRIDPVPMPVGGIIAFNIVFVAFFAAILWLTRDQVLPRFIYGAIIGTCLMTCGLFTLVVYHSFDKARRLGPWLVYDAHNGRLMLPRDGVTFERDEILNLQYITTKRLKGGSIVNNERWSELNLITCREGIRKRWPLLRSISNVRAFDSLLKPLIEHTDLAVVRVEDQSLGWNVTERPYGRPT